MIPTDPMLRWTSSMFIQRQWVRWSPPNGHTSSSLLLDRSMPSILNYLSSLFLLLLLLQRFLQFCCTEYLTPPPTTTWSVGCHSFHHRHMGDLCLTLFYHLIVIIIITIDTFFKSSSIGTRSLYSTILGHPPLTNISFVMINVHL